MNGKKLTLATVAIALALFALTATPLLALDTVIGETGIMLNGERQHVRTQETNLGNLVADMTREYTGADIAVWNGGGIRASAGLGEITLEGAMEIMAFNNEIVALEMTGNQIKAMLEHGVSSFPEVSGKFLQVSGLRFLFDPSRPAGQRVQEIYVGSAPMEPGRTYVVATNEFLAAGGDDYTMLGDAEQIEIFDLTDQQLFIRYIQQNSPLFPMVEGRIVVIR
ncbi:MAG: hypothetical protein EA427_17400 [Spirochaetaceae bacterium]|nr:MAG: hypothetical protein EA427_17400 [Spirochaetaceae bacterium]